MFYDNDRHDLPSTHNQPLYITASVNGVDLKRAMLEPDSLINITSPSSLDVVGILREKMIRQPIEVSSFRGNKSFIVSLVNLDLTVGPIRAAHPIQVIDL